MERLTYSPLMHNSRHFLHKNFDLSAKNSIYDEKNHFMHKNGAVMHNSHISA